jgi:hypothetical protein
MAQHEFSATPAVMDPKRTLEEFLCWQKSIDRNGLAGLRVTCIRQYRSAK